MPEPELSQPLPLRQLLDEAVRRARLHFRALYLPVALPLALLWGLIPVLQQRWFRPWLPGTAGSNALLGAVGVMSITFVFLALQSLGAAALFVGALDGLGGREIQMSRAWKTVFRPEMIGTLLVRGVLLILGFSCCVLPGIYLYLQWCFAVPVMVEEGRFGFSAFGRSGDLAGYNPQRTFGTDPKVRAFVLVFVGTLIGYLVSMVTSLPLIVVQQVMLFRALAGGQRPDPATLMDGMLWLQVPTQILAILGETAVEIYVVVGLALLFFDVKHRKEGQDLEAAIGALAARDAPP